MNPPRLATLLLLAALAASPASAGVDLSWNGCTPDAAHAVEPYAATDHVLTVSLTGIEADVNGLDITIAILDYCSPEGNYIPQAWRFDPAGCQANLLHIARPASFDGCPGLVPGLGTQTFDQVSTEMIGGFLFPPDNTVITHPAVLVRFAQAFPTVHLSAGQRYVAGRITIPMGETVAGADPEGVKCGCGSAPRVLTLVKGILETPDGGIGLTPLQNEVAYWVDVVQCAIGPHGPPVTDGGGEPACLTTASHARSWGAIKAQYR